MPTTVLIVDDSEPTREVVRAILEREPGLVICGEAADGFDAIRKAEALRPDLILLDLAMPKLNGAQTALVLRRVLPETRIFLFTLFEEAVDALGPAIGVDVVLSKPDGLNTLVQRIRAFLSSRQQERAAAAADGVAGAG